MIRRSGKQLRLVGVRVEKLVRRDEREEAQSRLTPDLVLDPDRASL